MSTQMDEIMTNEFTNENQIETEFDFQNLFNKHKIHPNTSIKCHKEFNSETLEKNKKQIKYFQNYNLIKLTDHFCIDENELFQNNQINELDNSQRNKGKTNIDNYINDKDQNYFDTIQDKTIKDSFYCSYADYFDKIYVKNKGAIKNKQNPKDDLFFNDKEMNNLNLQINQIDDSQVKKARIYSLSCAGCFNHLNNCCELIRYFNNIFFSPNLENVFLDYMLILNTNELLDYIDKTIEKIELNLNDLINNNTVNHGKFNFLIFK